MSILSSAKSGPRCSKLSNVRVDIRKNVVSWLKQSRESNKRAGTRTNILCLSTRSRNGSSQKLTRGSKRPPKIRGLFRKFEKRSHHFMRIYGSEKTVRAKFGGSEKIIEKNHPTPR